MKRVDEETRYNGCSNGRNWILLPWLHPIQFVTQGNQPTAKHDRVEVNSDDGSREVLCRSRRKTLNETVSPSPHLEILPPQRFIFDGQWSSVFFVIQVVSVVSKEEIKDLDREDALIFRRIYSFSSISNDILDERTQGKECEHNSQVDTLIQLSVNIFGTK